MQSQVVRFDEKGLLFNTLGSSFFSHTCLSEVGGRLSFFSGWRGLEAEVSHIMDFGVTLRCYPLRYRFLFLCFCHPVYFTTACARPLEQNANNDGWKSILKQLRISIRENFSAFFYSSFLVCLFSFFHFWTEAGITFFVSDWMTKVTDSASLLCLHGN